MTEIPAALAGYLNDSGQPSMKTLVGQLVAAFDAYLMAESGGDPRRLPTALRVLGMTEAAEVVERALQSSVD